MHVQYEMFVDKGGKKISKSAGNVFTPQVWYRYGSMQSLNLLIYKRFVGTKSGSVDDIPTHMDELDELEDIYFGKRKVKDQLEYYKRTGLYEYSYLLNPPEEPEAHVPFNLMVNLAKVSPPGNESKFMRAKLDDYGYLKETDRGIDDRISRTLNWIRDIDDDKQDAIVLTDVQRKVIRGIIEELRKAEDVEAYQATIFNVAKALELKARDVFPVVYRILLRKDRGPRFGPYVGLVGKESVIASLEAAL